MAKASLQQAAAVNGAAHEQGAPDFRALFDTLPGLFVVFDPGLAVVAVSDGYCRAAGVTRDTMMSARAHDQMPGGAELRSSLIAVLQRRVATSEMIGAFERHTTPANGDVGRTHHWRRTNTPVFGADGEVAWIVHALEDMSEALRACHDEIARRSFAGEERRKMDRNGKPIEAPHGAWGSFP